MLLLSSWVYLTHNYMPPEWEYGGPAGEPTRPERDPDEGQYRYEKNFLHKQETVSRRQKTTTSLTPEMRLTTNFERLVNKFRQKGNFDPKTDALGDLRSRFSPMKQNKQEPEDHISDEKSFARSILTVEFGMSALPSFKDYALIKNGYGEYDYFTADRLVYVTGALEMSGRTFHVILDTGSSDVVVSGVMCSRLDGCGKKPRVSLPGFNYDQPLVDDRVSYVSGGVNGIHVSSTLTQADAYFGELKITHPFNVFLITSVNTLRFDHFGPDGILGLSGVLSSYDTRKLSEEMYGDRDNFLVAMYKTLEDNAGPKKETYKTLLFTFSSEYNVFSSWHHKGEGFLKFGVNPENCTGCLADWFEFPVVDSRTGYFWEELYPQCNRHVRGRTDHAKCWPSNVSCSIEDDPECCGTHGVIDENDSGMHTSYGDIAMCPWKNPFRCGNSCYETLAKLDGCCKTTISDCYKFGGSRDKCTDGHWRTDAAVSISAKTINQDAQVVGSFVLDTGSSILMVDQSIEMVASAALQNAFKSGQRYTRAQVDQILDDLPPIKITFSNIERLGISTMTYNVSGKHYAAVVAKDDSIDINQPDAESEWHYELLIEGVPNIGPFDSILGLPFFHDKTVLFKHQESVSGVYVYEKESIWIGTGVNCCSPGFHD